MCGGVGWACSRYGEDADSLLVLVLSSHHAGCPGTPRRGGKYFSLPDELSCLLRSSFNIFIKNVANMLRVFC